jgi:hypothetical protein
MVLNSISPAALLRVYYRYRASVGSFDRVSGSNPPGWFVPLMWAGLGGSRYSETGEAEMLVTSSRNHGPAALPILLDIVVQ